MNERVLIVPFQPLGTQQGMVVCQLKNGAQWAIPVEVFNQFSHEVLDAQVKEEE